MREKVTFIIPTYNRVEPLRCMLYSLLCQTSMNWKAIVMVDDVRSGEKLESLLEVDDPRILYLFTDHRYNDWGHTPRQMGKQLAQGEYIIMSGDDNYYVPTAVAEMEKMMEDAPGVIYWDMVHSHYDYVEFKCAPSYNCIDMGAFATRRDIAQAIKLSTTFAADGEFIEQIKLTFPREQMRKIDKVLFVHN